MIDINEEFALDVEGIAPEKLHLLLKKAMETLPIPVTVGENEGNSYLEFSAEHVEMVKAEIKRLEQTEQLELDI